MNSYRYFALLLFSIFAFALGGCVSSPKAIADPKFGALPQNYQKTIVDWLTSRGRVAHDDKIALEIPRGGVVQDNAAGRIQNHFGWIVHVSADPAAKPSTYIGPRYFYFMFGADGHFGDITDAWVRGWAAYSK